MKYRLVVAAERPRAGGGQGQGLGEGPVAGAFCFPKPPLRFPTARCAASSANPDLKGRLGVCFRLPYFPHVAGFEMLRSVLLILCMDLQKNLTFRTTSPIFKNRF